MNKFAFSIFGHLSGVVVNWAFTAVFSIYNISICNGIESTDAKKQ